MPASATSGAAGKGIATATGLENDFGMRNSIETFKASLLATETSVRIISLNTEGSYGDRVLDDKEFEAFLKGSQSSRNATLFVNRFLVKANEPWPNDANKLRLSQSAFDLLRSHFQLSPSFLNALAHIQHASPRNFPNKTSSSNLDFWFFVPVRVQVQCLDNKAHKSSSKGKSQMNPLNYLHLVHPDVDIRGSKIAVYYSFNTETNRASSVVFNFQDGRWKKVVEEPILRLRDTYRGCDSAALGCDPVYLQMAILNSVLRWWDNSLNSFNDQLIAYEEALIRQDLTNEDLPRLNADTNQSLHCMAAHLHRYGSELRSLSDILKDIESYNSCLHNEFAARGVREARALGRIMTTLDQASSYLSAICLFRDELQQKIDNVLALLIDNTQAMSDRLLVQNSKAMQAILQATQAEVEASRQVAIQSQRLAEKMMKDSVAMKTAILSMPFFNGDPWLKASNRIWIWLALTIPSTLLCFMFYLTWSHRESKRKAATAQDLELQLQNASIGNT